MNNEQWEGQHDRVRPCTGWWNPLQDGKDVMRVSVMLNKFSSAFVHQEINFDEAESEIYVHTNNVLNDCSTALS
jgi:hypothetical protein